MKSIPSTVAQSCPLCAGVEHEVIKRFEDGVVVGRCRACRLLYTPERHAHPDQLLAGSTLEALRYVYAPIVSGQRRHFRARTFQHYLRVVGRHTRGRRLLDVGCAHGFLLAEARDQGFEVAGIEPSPAMTAFATQQLGLRVLQGRLDEVSLGEERWDAILLTDSAEYFPDPVRDLGQLVQHLAHDGVMFVKVPNGDYFRLRQAVERLVRRPSSQQAFSPSRRVVHYTQATLARLFARIGLDVVETAGMGGVDSPVWPRLTGLWLEMESPWYLGVPAKLVRRCLSFLGRIESTVAGQDHCSQSVYAVGRPRATRA